MKGLTELLLCPRSGGKLSFHGGQFVAADGSFVYPVEDGIIDLRCNRKDYYFNPVPRDAMSALTEQARQGPWWRIIRGFLGHVRHNPDWLDNLVADGRYAWKLLLDLEPNAQVLDLGCGLGNLTKNLAPHVGRVFAMDLTIERLRFARERFARFNRSDDIVLLAGGDGRYLPFADESLDVVVLSGVLEWVADDEHYGRSRGGKLMKATRMALSFFGRSNPRAIQRRFLQEIRRVLKPTGQLFIAIENRFNLEYLHRRRDHHSGLRYGSLLPRFFANMYSILAARRPYRTYTHSLGGYRRLLKSAGFSHQQFFGLSPGYSRLAQIHPLVVDEGFWAPERSAGLWQRIAEHPSVAPAFGIIATPLALRRSSLLGRMLSDIEARLELKDCLRVRRFRLTKQDQGVLEVDAGQQRLLVRTPFNAAALTGYKRQCDALAQFRKHPEIRDLLPEMPLHASLRGVDYFVETRMPGTALSELLPEVGRDTHLQSVLALLATMNGLPATAQLEGDLFRSEVTEPLKRLAQAVDSAECIAPLEAFLRARLRGVSLPVGIVHGEFTVDNILVAEGRVNGLVGSRFFRPAGLPILDLLEYLCSVQRRFEPQDPDLTPVELLVRGTWPSQTERESLQTWYASHNIGPELHPALACLCWVHAASRQLTTYAIYDPRAMAQRIVRVLDRLTPVVSERGR